MSEASPALPSAPSSVARSCEGEDDGAEGRDKTSNP